MPASPTQIKATCHCGAVTVTAPGTPKRPINECQCTICRRYAAAWAYYTINEVSVDVKEGSSTKKYAWRGHDSDIEYHFCGKCGCVVYYWPTRKGLEGEVGEKMAINSRMMEQEAVREVNREIDFDALRM